MNDLADDHAIAFGPFRLLAKQRLLLEGDRPVRLGSRALGILIALAERPGELVSKRDLMKLVWSGATVLEGNIKVNVAELRRALGDGQAGNRYIVNDPGRGYRFVAPIVSGNQPSSGLSPPEAAAPPTNLPAQLTRLVGRRETVSTIVRLFQSERLLTLVGPAGVGKTAVALEAAKELLPAFADGVWLIDLAPIADPRRAATAAAANLRIEVRSADPLSELLAAIGDKRMLLVLDNCEHLIDAAAELAAGILRAARGVAILATSREALRVNGERVRRLSPLASPPASVKLNAVEALGFAAVQLFVERATAAVHEFELTDADSAAVGDICRRLDGLPLAIELAAARVGVFGVRGLASRLGDRLRLLAGGRRGALFRHQTIGAALDWSYQLLGKEEQAIFRRLGIFAGSFTMEAAAAVAADAEARVLDITDIVASLAAKSLVAAEIGDADARFRLLETMRAYALTKLAESGEAEVLARRHAAHFTALFERADAESLVRSRNEWLAVYGREIDNLRSALGWAFSPGGEISMGVELTTFSIAIWANLSLTGECVAHVEQALQSTEGTPREARNEMRLYWALGRYLLFTKGATPEADAALGKSLTLAETLGDADYQARIFYSKYAQCFWTANYPAALEYAQKFRQVAANASDDADISVGDGMAGVAHHYLGDQALARRHLEGQPAGYAEVARPSDLVRFQYDVRLLWPAVLSITLWLQGLPEQALRATRRSIRLARETGHPLSLCLALTEAIWPMLLAGAVTDADLVLAEQTELALRVRLPHFVGYGRGLRGVLNLKIDSVDSGLALLRAAVDELSSTQALAYRLPAFLGELAQGLGKVGRTEEGIAAVDEALELCQRSGERWCLPELLRIKGVLLGSFEIPGAVDAARDHFVQAGDLARRQGALSWELRVAISLGQLLHARGEAKEAHDLLSSVYARFTEGFETADLRSARRFLEEWASNKSVNPIN